MKRYYTTDENLILKSSYENAPKTLDELFNLFLKAWTIDTCAPRLVDKWSINNPTAGQCSVTAFVIQDIYGGEVLGIPLGDGHYHCFNYIDGVIFDLTCEQFNGEHLTYTRNFPQTRDEHLSRKEKYDRYILLKNNLTNLF